MSDRQRGDASARDVALALAVDDELHRVRSGLRVEVRKEGDGDVMHAALELRGAGDGQRTPAAGVRLMHEEEGDAPEVVAVQMAHQHRVDRRRVDRARDRRQRGTPAVE